MRQTPRTSQHLAASEATPSRAASPARFPTSCGERSDAAHAASPARFPTSCGERSDAAHAASPARFPTSCGERSDAVPRGKSRALSHILRRAKRRRPRGKQHNQRTWRFSNPSLPSPLGTAQRPAGAFPAKQPAAALPSKRRHNPPRTKRIRTNAGPSLRDEPEKNSNVSTFTRFHSVPRSDAANAADNSAYTNHMRRAPLFPFAKMIAAPAPARQRLFSVSPVPQARFSP